MCAAVFGQPPKSTLPTSALVSGNDAAREAGQRRALKEELDACKAEVAALKEELKSSDVGAARAAEEIVALRKAETESNTTGDCATQSCLVAIRAQYAVLGVMDSRPLLVALRFVALLSQDPTAAKAR